LEDLGIGEILILSLIIEKYSMKCSVDWAATKENLVADFCEDGGESWVPEIWDFFTSWKL
jgi:hypothetical protein